MENKELATTGLKVGLVVMAVGAVIALMFVPFFINNSMWGFVPLIIGLLVAIAGVFIVGATNGAFRYFLNYPER